MVNYTRSGVTGKMLEATLSRRPAMAMAGSWNGEPYRSVPGGPSEAEIYSALDTLLKYPPEDGHPDAARYAAALRSLQGLVETFSAEAKQARADLLQWREEQRRSYAPPTAGQPSPGPRRHHRDGRDRGEPLSPRAVAAGA